VGTVVYENQQGCYDTLEAAQKWLKDRKGRKFGFDDVQHYRKIIAVLCETERIMGK
jgi:hypothetical protein